MTLTSDEIQGMRDTIDAHLPDDIVILRTTQASDGQGGRTNSYATVETVPGRISPLKTRDQEKDVGGRIVGEGLWEATLPHGTVLHEKDRLQLGGDVFEVSRVEETRSWSLGCRAQLREVT